MQVSEDQEKERSLKICGKIIAHIHKDLIHYIEKNKKKFVQEPISRHRGTDFSENSWANQMADIYLSQAYKVLKQKEVDNPPKAIMNYFESKGGDKKFWHNNETSHNILMLIMCRNMDNAKVIYNYKNKIYAEHSREQMKKILFDRLILEKKKNG